MINIILIIVMLCGCAPMGRTPRQKISWKPHPGAQTYILQRQERELLYGGSRGGGKTAAGLAWLVMPPYIFNPEYRALVIRKNSDNLSDWESRARIFYRPLGAKITGKPPHIRFPSGAEINTGHLKDENAYTKYQGHEYHKILIEELTQIARESDFERLISSCRSTVPGLRPQVMSNANPGGAGHVWVKNRYVDVARNKTYYVPGTEDPISGQSLTRIFIPARIYDNPSLMQNDPMYLQQLRSIKDVKLRAAWLDGDWSTFSGQFFDTFSYDVHVIKPFTITDRWNRYGGLDWGYAKPSCMLWGTTDFEGNLYVYREFYKAGLVPEQLANEIKSRTGNEVMSGIAADPSMWVKNQYGVGEYHEGATAESYYDRMTRTGLYGLKKANNDRINGWQVIRNRMYWDANHKPTLYIFENCENLIRTLPGLVYDEKKLSGEDLDTDGEDHAADALRYMVMHVSTSYDEKPKAADYIESQFRRLEGSISANNWDKVY